MTQAIKLAWDRDRRFASVPWTEIKPKASSWLVKGVLPRTGTGFMVGASKAGKTFVALDWAFKVAAGSTVIKRTARQCGVVYLAAEDPEGCAVRVEAIKRKFPRESYLPFHMIPARVNLLDSEEVDQLIAELLDLDALFQGEGHPLGLVVLDTLSRCLPGAEENSSQSMSMAVDALDRIGRETGAFILALAHHGKDAQRGIRGWSGLDAASDATITVERGDDKEGDPNLRTITMSKVKNGKDGDQVAFRLERQALGIFDEDGEEMWSCYVAYDHADVQVLKTAGKRRKSLSPNDEMVLSALGRLVDKEIRQLPPNAAQGVKPGTWAVRRADLSAEAMGIGLRFDDEKANTYNARFGRSVQALVAAGRIRQEGDLIWAI